MFGPMIPGVLIFLTFCVWLVFASFREKRRNELLARFIERGQEIPGSLLPQPQSRQRALRTGTLLTLASLALGVALQASTHDFGVVVWCLIPLSLGLGCFINAAFFYPDPASRQ